MLSFLKKKKTWLMLRTDHTCSEVIARADIIFSIFLQLLWVDLTEAYHGARDSAAGCTYFFDNISFAGNRVYTVVTNVYQVSCYYVDWMYFVINRSWRVRKKHNCEANEVSEYVKVWLCYSNAAECAGNYLLWFVNNLTELILFENIENECFVK